MALLIPQTGSASQASLDSLAARYGDLPTDYLNFLDRHDGTAPPENTLEGSNHHIGVRKFIPAESIIPIAGQVDGLRDDLIPIAEDGSGNYVCIGSGDHQIYFWDHEIDRDQIISRSFSDFLSCLMPFDSSEITLKPGQVKRIWIDPDFRPEF